MTSLILMYVYYDINGDIKAITPSVDDTFSTKFFVATFPIQEVEGFLTSQKNPFDYTVKEIDKFSGKVYKISKKEVKVIYLRSLDNYLTKVDYVRTQGSIVVITNNVLQKSISIQVNKGFKQLLSDGTDEEQDEVQNFLNHTSAALYFTKKNDPYHLLHSVMFSPREAFSKERISFDYTTDLSSASVYTRKIINSYGYLVKGLKNGI